MMPSINAVAVPGRVGMEECYLDLVYLNKGHTIWCSDGRWAFL